MTVAFEITKLQRKIHHKPDDPNRIPLSTFVLIRQMITLGSTHKHNNKFRKRGEADT